MMHSDENLETYISPRLSGRKGRGNLVLPVEHWSQTHEVKKNATQSIDHRSFIVSREKRRIVRIALGRNFIRPMKNLFRYLKAQKKG